MFSGFHAPICLPFILSITLHHRPGLQITLLQAARAAPAARGWDIQAGQAGAKHRSPADLPAQSVQRQQRKAGIHEEAGVEHHCMLPIQQRGAPHKQAGRSLRSPQHRHRRRRHTARRSPAGGVGRQGRVPGQSRSGWHEIKAMSCLQSGCTGNLRLAGVAGPAPTNGAAPCSSPRQQQGHQRVCHQGQQCVAQQAGAGVEVQGCCVGVVRTCDAVQYKPAAGREANTSG